MGNGTPSFTFPEPESLPDAHRRRAVVYGDIRAIQMQLARRDFLHADGKKSNTDAAWRDRATVALTAKEVEYNFLGEWIEAERARCVAAPQADEQKALARLWCWINESGNLTPADRTDLAAVRAYLVRAGLPVPELAAEEV